MNEWADVLSAVVWPGRSYLKWEWEVQSMAGGPIEERDGYCKAVW